MGLHDSYPGDSTSRMHSGFGYAVDGQPFQIVPDYDATEAAPDAPRVAGTDEELMRLWSHAIDNEDFTLAQRISAEAQAQSVPLESPVATATVLPASIAAELMAGDPRASLIDDVQKARSELVTLGGFLAKESIDEGDPGRDVTADPLYVKAQERLLAAQRRLEQF